MKKLLFVPWSVTLPASGELPDPRAGVYARQVPRYLALRLDELEEADATFAPYCMEGEAGPVFIVSSEPLSGLELCEIGQQYGVEKVIGGRLAFGDASEVQIGLFLVDVASGEVSEQELICPLDDARLLLQGLLHLLAKEIPLASASLLTCDEMSTRWPAVSAFFCAIDRLMGAEMTGQDEEPEQVIELFFEMLSHDLYWDDGAEQLIGTALDYGLDGTGPLPLAIDALQRLTDVRPDLHKAWEALGYLFSQQDLAEDAVRCLEEARQLAPDRFASHYRLGSIYRQLGRLSEAETLIRAGLVADPDNIPMLNELGVVLGECDRSDEAVAFFQRVVELSPISGAFYANLGVSLKRAGRLAEAEAAFEQGLSAVDAHWNVYVNYAQLLQEQQRHADWVRVLFHGIHALADQTKERHDLATRLVEGVREWVIGVLPKDIRSKGTGWVIGLLESLVELVPEHSSSWVVLSEYYRQEGKQELALECLNRVEMREPDNGWLKIHIGSILAGLGLYEDAVQRFEQALQVEANNQVALANLIMLHTMNDRLDEALPYLERYRSLNFEDPEVKEWNGVLERAIREERLE